MIEGIVTDVLTLLQIAYETVKGVKANSATRNVLLARIESLRAIISTIQPPALDSPVSSALADIKETVQSIADTVGAHEKRGWAQKALKVSVETSELERLDQRLVAGQSQLCLAISAENVNHAIKVRFILLSAPINPCSKWLMITINTECTRDYNGLLRQVESTPRDHLE